VVAADICNAEERSEGKRLLDVTVSHPRIVEVEHRQQKFNLRVGYAKSEYSLQ
jgi:hypothetical protein